MAIPALDPFQVIGDPSRRQILRILSKETCNINRLAEKFEISRPAISKHISILQTAGFITIHEIGRERYCTLNQDGFKEVQDWINYFDAFWNSKLKKLEIVLNKKSKN